MASPLGLWLLRVVHIEGRRDPQPLIDPGHYPDVAAIRHRLLEELIPAAVRSRLPLRSGRDPLRPKRCHDPEQVRRWLITLAKGLRDANTRDWRWWQLARHPLTRGQIGLMFGLMIGLVSMLVDILLRLTNVPVAELRGVLMSGLMSGLTFGLPAGLVIGLMGGDRDEPAHTDLRLRGRARALSSELAHGLARGLVFGLVLVLAGGLGIGLFNWLGGGSAGLVEELVRGVVSGLAFGLLIASAFGLAFGLISAAASPSIARRASSPAESQRGDRRLTVLAISMFGLPFGLAFGLTGGQMIGPAFGLMNGLATGLLFGLAGGPVMAKTCWPTFILASLWLRARRRLPLRLMGFLDDAYRLGLLRIVGPVYQFRHATLQDHLAPPRESAAPRIL